MQFISRSSSKSTWQVQSLLVDSRSLFLSSLFNAKQSRFHATMNKKSGSGEKVKYMIRNDASEALKTKPTSEIFRAVMILQICSFNFIIRNSDRIIMGLLNTVPGLAKFFMRPFFRHFCAGSSDEEAIITRKARNQLGIDCALDYAAEGEVGGKNDGKSEWEHNESFRLKSIDASSTFNEPINSTGKKSDGFVAIKITSLGNPDILQKLSSNSATKLSEQEKQELEEIKIRLQNTLDYCASKSVHVLMDAEQSWVQPAIDDIVIDMQRKYNVPGSPIIIYQTYQCYLKNSQSRLEHDMNLAKKEGWNFAAKLVRGAYIKSERERSIKTSTPFPIQDSFENTRNSYESCTKMMIEEMKNLNWSLVLATHNPGSVEYALDLIGDDENVKNKVRFATLNGMSDYIALSLALHNFRVIKLLPYGPIGTVIPYLLRRAQENSSLLGGDGVKLERVVLRKELVRRLTSLGGR